MVSWWVERDSGNIRHHALKTFIASHEIGLGIDLYDSTRRAARHHTNQPVGRNTSGFFAVWQGLGAQPVNGGLPSFSFSAVLQSIMPAPEASRNSFTMLAVFRPC